MEEYTGDTNDSDEENIIFSLSPSLKKPEKTEECCRKNGL